MPPVSSIERNFHVSSASGCWRNGTKRRPVGLGDHLLAPRKQAVHQHALRVASRHQQPVQHQKQAQSSGYASDAYSSVDFNVSSDSSRGSEWGGPSTSSTQRRPNIGHSIRLTAVLNYLAAALGARSILLRRPLGSGPFGTALLALAMASLALSAFRKALILILRLARACASCHGYGIERCNMCSGRGQVRWDAKWRHMVRNLPVHAANTCACVNATALVVLLTQASCTRARRKEEQARHLIS